MEIVVGLSVLPVSFLESSGKEGETSEFLEQKSIKGHEAHAAPPHKVRAVGSKVGRTFFIFFKETSTQNILILSPHKTSAPHLDITWMVLSLARQSKCSPSKQTITVHQSLTTLKINHILLCGVSSGLGIIFRKFKAQAQVVKAPYQKYK